AFAADKPLKGVALVIGESGYGGALHPLTNPKNDARAMDGLLGDLGFDVTRVLDGDGKKLQSEIADFVAAAKDADVALVYYSGHGIEAGGENYLVPVDADMSTPERAGQTLIPLSDLLDELAKSVPVTIMLLDACRSNAFPAGTMIQLPGASTPIPAVESGLAEVRGPTPIAKIGVPTTNLGMVIGFAASPGQPALDGAPGEENSPYAAALLKHLAAGGYSFGDVMTMVGEEVYLKTKAQQLPWVNSSLRRVLNFGTPVEDTDADERAIKEGRRQLLLSIASEPAATRGTVESIANAEGVPLDALYGMLKVLGVDTSSGAVDLEQQLQQGAKQLKAFKEQELGTASSDPELKRLSDLAGRAQDEGAIDLALKYREQGTARARVLSGLRDKLEAGLKADRVEIGRTFAEHAQTASINFDYATAALMFGEAYGQVAKWDDDLAIEYKWDEAGALRDFGDFKADNAALEKAIAAYKDALLLAPKETRLHVWVLIANDLGWALETLGERQSDGARLSEAVEILQSAIDESPDGTPPGQLAVSRLNLGNAVSSLGQRDSDPARLRRALEIYQQAELDLPRSADPYSWGKIEFSLGSTLRILGERERGTETLEKAVTAFEASLEIITRQLSPLEWALAENNYAAALFAIAERRHDAAFYDRAVTALTLALEERTEDRVPLDWAMSQSNLGNVYVRLGDATGDVDTLRKGIDAYTSTLRQLDPAKVPLLYATAQSNIGVALSTLSDKTGDRGLLNDAVSAFEAALTAVTEQNDPPNWAMTQFNLSGALHALGMDEASPARLHQATDAANAALRQWTKSNQPFLWAKAHYALGNALISLGDKETGTDSYLRSIEAFEAALSIFNKQDSQTEWLLTIKKYAFALQGVGEQQGGADYLGKARDAYREVLTVVTLDDDPAEFGRMNFNLGLCLENLDDAGVAGALDEAIAAFRAALTAYPRDRASTDWADTQFRLGFAIHAKVSKASDGIDGISDAIAAYEAAQEIRTKEAEPFGWAEIENYKGTAYGLLGVRTNDKAALQQGRDDIAAAWEVFKSRDASYDEDFKGRLAQFDDAIAGMS
ncbi:MAG: caspase family protein, partial [Alphaproteobacteria bacterium]